MARITGSWLSGPQSGLENASTGYRGQALGLPDTGPGSLAGSWRRVLALSADWLMAYGVSLFFVAFDSPQRAWIVLGIWFVVGAVTVSLFNFTPGQILVGLRVARVDRPADAGMVSVGLWRALVRQILIVFIVPALINDADGRGMHDRATGTGLIRVR